MALHRMTLLCVLLACIGASWFAFQCLLVPQSARFTPEWHDAQWVQAADGLAPVAYFRRVTHLNVLPDAAFVTIAANQVFKLYVNGTLISSNAIHFGQGNFPAAYMYDIISHLRTGSNVLAVRVANLDKQVPSVRLTFGVVRGNMITYDGSGNQWQATAQSELVYPRYNAKLNRWTTKNFVATAWLPARISTSTVISPMVQMPPALYKQPLASHWISAENNHEAYFVRQFTLSPGVTHVWLRLAATGTASVFINGRLSMTWNGQAFVGQQDLADYLSDDETVVHYRSGLALGIYDISPDLHIGINTIAVRVVAPGVSLAQVGLGSLNPVMSLDILTRDWQDQHFWANSDADWHVSSRPVEGWQSGNTAALNWSQPIPVGRPGVSRLFYLPDTLTLRNAQYFPLVYTVRTVLFISAMVIGLWLVMALFLMCYYHRSFIQALELASLGYLPALACEALLIALSREPQITRPFPYTWFWGLILIFLVVLSYLLLWFNEYTLQKQKIGTSSSTQKQTDISVIDKPWQETLLKAYFATSQRMRAVIGKVTHIHFQKRLRVQVWFRLHWPVLLLVLVAIPLISYDLTYEPYWQDELSSYYASQGVLAHGLPFFPSGFLYVKAELYSYLLAGWTLLFGDEGGTPRLISVIEYLISIPLLYRFGSYLFERRVGLLAAAMLTFSPFSLVWGRQVRMYEQAQLMTLVVVYIFYKALQERKRTYLIYVAMLCLVANYLSHEETFIVLPALLLCMLLGSRDGQQRLPAVLYQKHWWFAALAGGSIIATQWLLTQITHPPTLGTDSSQRPFLQLTTDNIPYYINLFFLPSTLGHGTLPWITLNSILATAGCVWARRDTNPRAKYCALFLIISLATLVLIFTMQAERYIYALLPVYYLMGAYALVIIFRALWAFARPRLVLPLSTRWTASVLGGYLSLQMRLLVTGIVSCTCLCILLVPILPLSNYNLFISRLVGFSYHRHYPDYDTVGRYMQQHWRKGDIVISVAPDFCTYYYSGHVDYFFSIDRALFLLERDGHIINTSIGTIALLNQDDFQAILSEHSRIWIISDNGPYQAQVAKRFVFPPDFRIVFEGYGSAIYFRGG